MATINEKTSVKPHATSENGLADLRQRYGCGPVEFAGSHNGRQVAANRAWYNPRWHYENEPETRAAIDLISSDHFSRYEPGAFLPLVDSLLAGDHYMVLADLQAYMEADQRLVELYRDRDEWARRAILNVAASGKFSSDRTIAEYAAEIWKVEPCPVSE